MPDNIWLYGFDGFNGLKTVGFVIANTDTEAEHKVWRMYNDFGTDEYDLDDDYEDEMYEDEDDYDEYDEYEEEPFKEYNPSDYEDDSDIDDLDEILNARVRVKKSAPRRTAQTSARPKSNQRRVGHSEADDTFKMDLIDLD